MIDQKDIETIREFIEGIKDIIENSAVLDSLNRLAAQPKMIVGHDMSKYGERVIIMREEFETLLESYRLLRNKFLKAVPGMDLDLEKDKYERWKSDLKFNLEEGGETLQKGKQPEPSPTARELATRILKIFGDAISPRYDIIHMAQFGFDETKHLIESALQRERESAAERLERLKDSIDINIIYVEDAIKAILNEENDE